MAELPAEARAAIEAGALAHLVTLNRDGSPQVACVWVGVDGDELVCGHLGADQQKLKNIRRDPRVALSVELPTRNAVGMQHYVVVHGRAQAYVGPGTRFPPMPDPPPGFVTHITVERVGGYGPWRD